MAFQQFAFPQVIDDLGLTLADADLFAAVPPVPVDPAFAARIVKGMNLAAAINTEKAKSEFVIAPVLFELRLAEEGRIGLFSGVELNADRNRGLNGICDFLLTKSATQHVVRAPVVAVVEAKNDNPMTGLGQCIAAMAAAQILNRADPTGPRTVYGAVTSGSLWKFLRLTDTALILDAVEYHIDNLGKILGILAHMVRTA